MSLEVSSGDVRRGTYTERWKGFGERQGLGSRADVHHRTRGRGGSE